MRDDETNLIFICQIRKQKKCCSLLQLLQSTILKFNTNFFKDKLSMDLSQNLKDILSGFVSGWCQVFIMQPFEIIKVRLQTQSALAPQYHGIYDAFKKISKEEGIKSFYKGTVTPLIGIGFQASAMFFTYEFSKRLFGRFNKNQNDRLPLSFIGLSGICSSLPTSLIAAPVEHARIRIQIQKTQNVVYQGSIDAAVKILRQYGVRELYRGFTATWGRQALGQAAFFMTYEAILRGFVGEKKKVCEAPLWASIIGGGLAGISFFILAYPLDYMKTLMQTDDIENKKYKNLGSVLFSKFKEGGVKTFYKGIGVTLARAIFVNAGGLFSYEFTMRSLGRNQHS